MTYDNALVTLKYLQPKDYLEALMEMAPYTTSKRWTLGSWHLFLWSDNKGIVLMEGGKKTPAYRTVEQIKAGVDSWGWSSITQQLLVAASNDKEIPWTIQPY